MHRGFASAILALLAPVAYAATDNCIAGGAGYAVAFDGLDGTTVSLKWDNAPTNQTTVEYWAMLTDPHVDQGNRLRDGPRIGVLPLDGGRCTPTEEEASSSRTRTITRPPAGEN